MTPTSLPWTRHVFRLKYCLHLSSMQCMLQAASFTLFKKNTFIISSFKPWKVQITNLCIALLYPASSSLGPDVHPNNLLSNIQVPSLQWQTISTCTQTTPKITVSCGLTSAFWAITFKWQGRKNNPVSSQQFKNYLSLCIYVCLCVCVCVCVCVFPFVRRQWSGILRGRLFF